MKLWLVLSLLALALPARLLAQDEPGTASQEAPVSALPAAVPFGVGERLSYKVKFGPLEVGEGRMEVTGLETIEGHPVYHMVFALKGGTFFYKINDTQESWLDVFQLASRRYRQDLHQGDWERLRVWEFDLDNLTYQRSDGESGTIPAGALDEAAFIYFLRSVPMEVGETYQWNRYFREDRNPVILHILRRETIKVPAGEFETIVVRPIIKARGMYSEEGEAEIFITDDEWRIPVKLKSKLKVGSLTMELTEFVEGERITAAMLGPAR